MNYTTVFVVFSTIGVIVFIGIFGAAWLSATEAPTKGEVIPVVQSTSKSAELTSPTAWTSEQTNGSTDDYLTTSPPSKSLYISEEHEALTHSVSLTTTNKPTEGQPKLPPVFEHPYQVSHKESSENPDSCTSIILTNEKGEIKPEYVNQDSCQSWIVQYADGYSVDITIERLDLDGASGDYLLISTDGKRKNNNPVLSWKMKEKKIYRLPYKGTAYILFVSHKSGETDVKPGGFRIIYSRFGDITTTEPPTTPNLIPTTPPGNTESIIVFIEIQNLSTLEEDFKVAIASQANLFCEKENITIKENITQENVYLSNPSPCLESWPNSAKCVSLTIAVAVDTKYSNTYELTKKNLQKMWNEWDNEQLADYSVTKISGPSYKKHVILWSISSIIFIVLFSILLGTLWKWQLKNTHKANDNQYPTSAPIDVPPLFDYFDSRIDDPEYMPYYDSLYQIGKETSTDDIKSSHDTFPTYIEEKNNSSSTFQFGPPNQTGINNNGFIPEEDEEEYEVMNRLSLSKIATEINKEMDNKPYEKLTRNT